MPSFFPKACSDNGCTGWFFKNENEMKLNMLNIMSPSTIVHLKLQRQASSKDLAEPLICWCEAEFV